MTDTYTVTQADRDAAKVHTIEMCEGVAGTAIYLNGYRISGPRHNGVMKVIARYLVKDADMKEATLRAALGHTP